MRCRGSWEMVRRRSSTAPSTPQPWPGAPRRGTRVLQVRQGGAGSKGAQRVGNSAGKQGAKVVFLLACCLLATSPRASCVTACSGGGRGTQHGVRVRVPGWAAGARGGAELRGPGGHLWTHAGAALWLGAGVKQCEGRPPGQVGVGRARTALQRLGAVGFAPVGGDWRIAGAACTM